MRSAVAFKRFSSTIDGMETLIVAALAPRIHSAISATTLGVPLPLGQKTAWIWEDGPKDGGEPPPQTDTA